MNRNKDTFEIEIMKWEKYHPRKDYKSLPWIKIDTYIFDDPAWVSLPRFSMVLWLYLLTVCARNNTARVSLGVSLTGATLGLEPTSVRRMVDGFEQLQMVTVSSRSWRSRDKPVSKVKESKGKEKKEKRSKEKEAAPQKELALRVPELFGPHAPSTSPCEMMFLIYNRNCGPDLSPAKALNKTRREKMKDRWREVPDPAYWADVFKKAGESSFLTGKTERGWKANLDWLIKNDTNHVKVFEGAYDRGAGKVFKNQSLVEQLNKKWGDESEQPQTN